MQVNISKLTKLCIALITLTILAIIYKTHNPESSIFFPKCMFYKLTGLECPGCGSQRAVHYLLNFDIINASKENALLVLSLPYLFTGLVFDLINNPNVKILKLRNVFFGKKAIFLILTIIFLFWLLRNVI